MKDLIIKGIKPTADVQRLDKSARKDKPQGSGNFSQTLETTVARMHDLQNKAAIEVKRTDSDSIKEGLSTANDVYDKMMREQRNLSQLYQRMVTHKTEE